MGNLNQKPILYIRNQNENYFEIDYTKAKECTEPVGLAKNFETIKTNELETSIKINPFTENPDKAWEQIERKIIKNQLEPLKLDEPIYDNKIRFVFISDTHSKIDKMTNEIPDGDILIHAGDFTSIGKIDEVKNFSAFLKSLDKKFKYKIVIAGNHELSFDKKSARSLYYPTDEREPRDFLQNCIYLEDSYVNLYGLVIYGSPWQPRFGDWAFNIDRGTEILNKWNKIPSNTDILITHGPPLGFGDIVRGGYHVGCCELLSTIQERVKPKIHVFGHIHEDPGIFSDGHTTFINASTCNLQYQPKNPPILFDIDLPEGITKMEI